MFGKWRNRLWWPALMALSFSLGCRTTAPAPSDPHTLTVDEDRRVRALAHYATAVSLMAKNDLAAAFEEYRTAFDLDPGNSVLALWLAETYRSRQEMTNALAILDTASAANPASAEPWIARGLIWKTGESFTNAAAAFKQALKLEPTHPGAVRGLAETYLAMNDTNAVAGLLQQSFRKNSTAAGYWISLGGTHHHAIRQFPSLAERVGKNRIRQCYERALALTPRDPEALRLVGNACFDGGDFKAAADAYGRLIEIRPNIPLLREHLAAVYLKTDQTDKAIELYKELIKRDPLRFEYYNILAELSEETKKPSEAITYYEQSLKLNPEQNDIYLTIAELQRRLQRTSELTQTLVAWKKKYPTDWRIAYFNSMVANAKKDYAAALTAFAEAEKLASSAGNTTLGASFYFSYGATCERHGDLDKAAAMFRKAIAADPEFANAYNYLGYMWADKGTNLTEALTLIQKAVTLDPDNGAYRDSLGWVQYKLGNIPAALPELQRAIELLEKETDREPEDKLEDAVVYDHLAEVQLKLGKSTEAIQTWKRAAAIDPANKDVAAKLRQLTGDK